MGVFEVVVVLAVGVIVGCIVGVVVSRSAVRRLNEVRKSMITVVFDGRLVAGASVEQMFLRAEFQGGFFSLFDRGPGGPGGLVAPVDVSFSTFKG